MTICSNVFYFEIIQPAIRLIYPYIIIKHPCVALKHQLYQRQLSTLLCSWNRYYTDYTEKKFTHDETQRLGAFSNPNERRVVWTIGKCTSAKHGTLNLCQAMRLAELRVVEQRQSEVEMEKLENELLSTVWELSFGQKERARQTGHFDKRELRNALRTCAPLCPSILPYSLVSFFLDHLHSWWVSRASYRLCLANALAYTNVEEPAKRVYW